MTALKDGKYYKVQVDGRLMILTLNRPEVMNALHHLAHEELSALWDEFQENPDLWVGIVTGAGDRAFSAGNDLKYHAEYRAKTGKRPPATPKGFAGICSRFDLDKPLIAAVNGVAFAGGFLLALALVELLAAVLPQLSPMLAVTIRGGDVMQAAVVAVAVTLAAGLVPLARVLRVDPASVFRRSA